MKFIFVFLSIIALVSAAAIAPCRPGTRLSHAQALRILTAAGIGVTSSGHCSARNRPTCTSLDTIRCNTLIGLIAFKQASHCVTTVTGGTETGHENGQYSHWNGYKVDIHMTNCHTNWIHEHFRKTDNTHWLSGRNIYHYEGNHWDITYF
ncbi:hypothetical protein FRC12_009584 [Ceratobasidium sp. 428]|nr:hypothetical protein FRC12_009584 [Ceratobasidium sp. 428]